MVKITKRQNTALGRKLKGLEWYLVYTKSWIQFPSPPGPLSWVWPWWPLTTATPQQHSFHYHVQALNHQVWDQIFAKHLSAKDWQVIVKIPQKPRKKISNMPWEVGKHWYITLVDSVELWYWIQKEMSNAPFHRISDEGWGICRQLAGEYRSRNSKACYFCKAGSEPPKDIEHIGRNNPRLPRL